MKLSRNRTGYYIKEGVTSIFAHSLMSFASVCIILASLIIIGGFILLAVNINAIIGELEDDNIILAYVHENLDEPSAREMAPQLRRIPNVSSVTFVTREEAFYSFIGRHEDSDQFRDVEASWFRHRYLVFVEDVALIGETMEALRQVFGIDAVNANLAIAQALVTLRGIVTGLSVIIVAVLLAISLFIMSNTVKLAMYERREEIAIMKMVGATNAFIRWPFIYQGFILGMTGSTSAFAALWGLYGVAANRVYEFEAIFLNLAPFDDVRAPIFLLFAVIGFSVGVGGSGLAINRYLNV